MRLPVKLGKEPLIEALFEIRFNSSVPTSSLLPGVLFGSLSGDKSLERLPIASVPEQIRNADSNLMYAPLVRVDLKNFLIMIGDRSLSIACKLPYPGWKEFKPRILEIVGILKQMGTVDAVERCSIKASNIVPVAMGTPKELLRSEIKIASYDALEHLFQARVEVKEGRLLHIVQLAAEATATASDGTSRTGPLIDIDTILAVDNMAMEKLFSGLPEHLESLHEGNKRVFFSCLREEVLGKFEPQYD